MIRTAIQKRTLIPFAIGKLPTSQAGLESLAVGGEGSTSLPPPVSVSDYGIADVHQFDSLPDGGSIGTAATGDDDNIWSARWSLRLPGSYGPYPLLNSGWRLSARCPDGQGDA